MSGPTRPLSAAAASCALLALSWTVSGCASGPDIGKADIVGVWKSNRGGTLDFRQGGEFVAEDVTLGPDCDPKSERPDGDRASGKGTWSVDTFSDENPGAKMRFEPEDGPVRSCTVWTTFTTGDPASLMYLLHDGGDGERYKRS